MNTTSNPSSSATSTGAAPPRPTFSGRSGGSSTGGPTLVSRIKAKLPLVEFAQRHMQLKESPNRNGEFVGKCPSSDHDDSTASFYASSKTDAYHCHGCGISGNVIHLYGLFHNLEYNDAKLALGREIGVVNERRLDGPESMLSNLARKYAWQLQRKDDAMRYLVEERGLTAESIEKWGLGFCWGRECQDMSPEQKAIALSTGVLRPASDRGPERSFMAGRITFPVKNRSGLIVGFGGRLVPSELTANSKSPKYLNSPETELFKKSELLYGAWEAMAGINRDGYAVAVEGYMDVIALHQSSVTNAVAVMGAGANEQTYANLWAMTRRVVFCLDGDAAGDKGTLRSVLAAAPTMPDGCEIAIARLPAGQDPDEFVLSQGPDAFRRLCESEATPLSRFLMQDAAEKFDLTHAEGRAQFLGEAKRVAEMFASAPTVREQILAEARALNAASLVANAMSERGIDADVSVAELRDAMALLQRSLAGKAGAAVNDAGGGVPPAGRPRMRA